MLKNWKNFWDIKLVGGKKIILLRNNFIIYIKNINNNG